jgi:hypothetical protein
MKLCRSLGAVVILCALALSISATETRPRHKQAGADSQAGSQCVFDNSGRQTCPGTNKRTTRHARVTDANGNDARPRAWCGWQMRQWLGVADRAFNVASRWARYGTNAHGARGRGSRGLASPCGSDHPPHGNGVCREVRQRWSRGEGARAVLARRHCLPLAEWSGEPVGRLSRSGGSPIRQAGCVGALPLGKAKIPRPRSDGRLRPAEHSRHLIQAQFGGPHPPEIGVVLGRPKSN